MYIFIYYINISIDYYVETSLHVRVITSVLASSSNQWSFGEKSIMWANYKNRKPANLGVTSKSFQEAAGHWRLWYVWRSVKYMFEK